MSDAPSTRSYRCSPSRMRAALDEIRRRGGRATGSDSEGSVSVPTPLGPVEGSWAFDGEELSVTLLRRPPMVPERLIWEQLDAACGPPIGRA